MSLISSVHLLLLTAATKVSVNPDPGGLPGGDAAQKLINGAAAFGLMACLGAFLWGGAQWGLGSRSNNYSQADDGKSRMLKGVGGAFGIGAAAAVINFFFNAGSGVHP
ncbi:MAG TPA: hypothetical protein VF731_02385 [Solirubrobacterales bacterium]